MLIGIIKRRASREVQYALEDLEKTNPESYEIILKELERLYEATED